MNPISKDRLKGHMVSALLFSKHGSGHSKSLVVIVNPLTKDVWYGVEDHGKIVYAGGSLDDAIDIYNNIVA